MSSLFLSQVTFKRPVVLGGTSRNSIRVTDLGSLYIDQQNRTVILESPDTTEGVPLEMVLRFTVFQVDSPTREVLEETKAEPKTLCLDEVIEGSQRAGKRVSEWPDWKAKIGKVAKDKDEKTETKPTKARRTRKGTRKKTGKTSTPE